MMQMGEQTAVAKAADGGKDRVANNRSTPEASGLCIESAVQKIANSMLGASAMKVADIRRVRQVEHGLRLHRFSL